MTDKSDVIGWTKEEYMQCPELAARLHGRILDLEDALILVEAQVERLRAALGPLLDVACGKLNHLYDGSCPDAANSGQDFDANCSACQAILAVNTELSILDV